jgi:hypothetical protein
MSLLIFTLIGDKHGLACILQIDLEYMYVPNGKRLFFKTFKPLITSSHKVIGSVQ